MSTAENGIHMSGPPDRKALRLVIWASSLGALFEWYDFYIYGTLAVLFGKLFFPEASPATGLLLALATFGVGFVVRPFGAVLFGVLGDRLGRKYTFIATITLMGLATAAIGCLPTFASIGIAAPILLVAMRALQGLALGGEYGGATIYVAEHVAPGRRGFFTSFIQATRAAGAAAESSSSHSALMWIIGEAAWQAWGWRIPFLFSLVLLAISLWMRIKLAESPVFRAMKAAGEVARHPLRESFDSWPKVKMMLAALVGVCAGQAVIGYTVMFQTLYYLQHVLHVEALPARLIVIAGAVSGVLFLILFGWLSDRVGRKKPLVIGYVLGIGLIFPYFHRDGCECRFARHARCAADPGLRCEQPVIRVDRRVAGGAVSAARALHLALHPLSLRNRLRRRTAALHQPVHRRPGRAIRSRGTGMRSPSRPWRSSWSVLLGAGDGGKERKHLQPLR